MPTASRGLVLQRLAAAGKLDTVEVAEPTGTPDREGQVGFGDWQEITARVNQVDEDVVGPDGQRVQTSLKVMIPRGEDPLPGRDWKVRWRGTEYKVMWLKEVKSLSGELAHLTVRCSFGDTPTDIR